ncbi:MAG: ATP-dependent Clp protease ATP-binding subunit ClpB [Rhodothermales bacterium]
MEREAVKRERDETKLSSIGEVLANLEEKRTALRARWNQEKELIQELRQSKEEIEEARLEAETLEREGKYGEVAEIRYGRIPQLEQTVTDTKERLMVIQRNGALLKEEVDAEDIASIVSRWTGVPVSRMLESERAKLLRMEEELEERVIGQPEAVAAVSHAVRRGRAGLQEESRPIGSFIFLGTTGVGKTELAKALADFLFNDENALIRIDMSEYQERHTVSRLVGAPPGYVGYEEGGQLTEKVRRRPYSVVLLDEIEKAHPEVFNILLQVLDDGRLTDNQGRTVDFKNTIVIMTSNLGSEIIRDRLDALDGQLTNSAEESLKDEVMNLLKKRLRPEFLNRIDETIVFHPLGREVIGRIVDVQIASVQKLASTSAGVILEITPEARVWLGDKGFDPVFGARPLKRVIQREVTNKLAEELLAGWIERGETIRVDLSGDGSGLTFETLPAEVSAQSEGAET